MRRIFFYCRNSTMQQEYQYQIDNLNSELSNRKDCKLIKIYAEKISGFKSEKERPEMLALLSDVDASLVDEIWVNEFSRLSRDAINLQIICQHCAERKVDIYFKSNGLRLLDATGEYSGVTKLIISILAQFAEMDAKNFREKQKQGKKSKVETGNFTGGVLPVGYDYADDGKNKKLIIDERQRKVVEYVFNSYVQEDITLSSIANDLNNFKQRDPDFRTKLDFLGKGKELKYKIWYVENIKAIINSTWYAKGVREWNGEKILLDENLKFIDLELWERANEKLAKNKNNKGYNKDSINNYLLDKLIYCACGEQFKAHKSREVLGYICKTNIRRYIDKSFKCDDTKIIQIEKLENAIWLLIKNKLPDFKIAITRKSNKEFEIKERINYNNKLIEVIRTKTIGELKEQRKRANNLYVDFGGDYEEHKQKINSIDRQIKEQEKIISNYQTENTQLLLSIQNLDIATEIEKNIQLIESDKDLMKSYLRKLIKSVTLCASLKGSNHNVFRIDFVEGVGTGQPLYLFYSLHKFIKQPFYYFIQSEQQHIIISWEGETKSFTVFDNELNDGIRISINDVMQELNSLYTYKLNTDFPDLQFFNYFLYHDEKSATQKLKFPVNFGLAPLELIISFKKSIE